MTSTTTDTRFTVDDYMALPEGFPAQLIDGWLVKEAAPTWKHQGISMALTARALAVVGQHRLLAAPADLILDRWNVLQPDLLVFAGDLRAAQPLREIPVLVVEILSPGTQKRDRGAKVKAYLRAGVGEVWLVDPVAGEIEIRTTTGATKHRGEEEAVSKVVEGFRVSWRSLAE